MASTQEFTAQKMRTDSEEALTDGNVGMTADLCVKVPGKPVLNSEFFRHPVTPAAIAATCWRL